MRTDAAVRADELECGDRVLLFGAVTEVLDRGSHSDFPGTVRLAVRRWSRDEQPGRPLSTLLPADHLLIGLWLPRQLDVPCTLCLTPVQARVNLAEGRPRRVTCRWCAGPLVEGTVVLPAVSPVRRW